MPGERRQRLRCSELAARRRPAAPEKSVFEATLEANVVNEFAGGGTIDMDCTNNGAGLTVSAIQSKIIAIKVGDITGNEAVTG
jgi:hypothetical protein